MALCAAVAACSAASAPQIALDAPDPRHTAVLLTGLSRADLRAVERAAASPGAWPALLGVSVAPGLPLVAGRYTVDSGAIRFTPFLPFEPGRTYTVTFDPRAVPGGALAHLQPVTRQLSTPAPSRAAQVHVAGVYPTGPVVPANLLRMYIEFSGPMGTRTGEDYVSILDARGNALNGALLPLDTDLWNGDRTRFTVLFDPGRVKRGILPNRAMGRPLQAGGAFTIVVSRTWPDAQGQPLASDFRKEYRVGPAIERALDTASWRLTAPAAGSRDALRVTFPAAIDYGLGHRALTIVRAEQAVAGAVRLEDAERTWLFTPRDAWTAGDYVLLILPALEDPSGNRPGRPFEAVSPGDDTSAPPRRLGFRIE